MAKRKVVEITFKTKPLIYDLAEDLNELADRLKEKKKKK